MEHSGRFYVEKILSISRNINDILRNINKSEYNLNDEDYNYFTQVQNWYEFQTKNKFFVFSKHIILQDAFDMKNKLTKFLNAINDSSIKEKLKKQFLELEQLETMRKLDM